MSETKYIFFSGKGGVGKTTMASATAIHYAAAGHRTLIVTTDPASNLADVFEQDIGHKVTPIQRVPNLHAMEIDPDEATRQYKDRIINPFRDVMPADIIASLEEQFNSPCTTEMASFDRFVDFMDGGDYDVVVFDTAPTGHTIRLLELPVDWSKHIEQASKTSGQTCMGPVQAIQESKGKYDKATALLRDTVRTSFVFVMRPESLSLFETVRAARELGTIGIRAGELIINGTLPENVCDVEFFRKKYAAQQKIIKEAVTAFPARQRIMELRDNEVKGVAALKAVADELFDARKAQRTSGNGAGRKAEPDMPGPVRPDLDALFLPRKGETKVLFFTGKGGVGKTTVSCMAGLYLAKKGLRTLVVTTDPAAHLGEVFDRPVGNEPTKISENLDAVMVDQKKAFKEYKDKVLLDAKGKYSADMLAAIEEEIDSPCTEEMAAFDKFAQHMDHPDYDVVVIDTAPTGHTLRLLDLPFDYAKQVEMMVASENTGDPKSVTQERFQKMIKNLRDKSRFVFSIVLYPESTPILESYRAMLDLKEAGIEAQLVVANMVLPKEVCSNDFFRSRRRMQTKYLHETLEKFQLPVLQIPMMREDIRGLSALGHAVAGSLN